MNEIKQDMGHWEAKWEFTPSEFVGFLYKITNMTSGRIYIGKKFLQSTTKKVVKGKRNKKKIVKDSDWRKYTGSSSWLNEEIALYGKDKFKFEILSLHESRSTLAWAETEYLVKHDALRAKMPDGTKQFYNGIVVGIKYTVKEETEKEKEYKI